MFNTFTYGLFLLVLVAGGIGLLSWGGARALTTQRRMSLEKKRRRRLSETNDVLKEIQGVATIDPVVRSALGADLIDRIENQLDTNEEALRERRELTR